LSGIELLSQLKIYKKFIFGIFEFIFGFHRAVAVINVDICVSGDILEPSASPVLKSVFVEAIKNVPSTKDQSKTYYQFLKEYYKNGENPVDNIEDKVKILGSGSDHAPFAYYAGVPALYYSFKIDKQKYPGIKSSYPMYHTGYETFYLMDHLVDPGFKLHKTCTQLSLHMIFQRKWSWPGF
jgi:N-acetylated-alpha-linked acidic dipeptidase